MSPHRAQSMECVDDSPDSSEQSDEWRHRSGDREPWYVAFETRDLLGGCDLHGALNRHGIVNAASCSHLALEFVHRAFKHAYQRAGTKLFRHRSNILHALRLAKGADEASALRTRTTDQTPLGKNHSPGKHAERDEQEKYSFGDRTGLKDEINDFAANEREEDGRKMHRFRENPYSDYRLGQRRVWLGYRIGQRLLHI